MGVNADNARWCCFPQVRRVFTQPITFSANTMTFLWGEIMAAVSLRLCPSHSLSHSSPSAVLLTNFLVIPFFLLLMQFISCSLLLLRVCVSFLFSIDCGTFTWNQKPCLFPPSLYLSSSFSLSLSSPIPPSSPTLSFSISLNGRPVMFAWVLERIRDVLLGMRQMERKRKVKFKYEEKSRKYEMKDKRMPN